MRPPYGAVNKTVLSAVGGYNLCCMNWSLDTEDWKTKNADATYNEVVAAGRRCCIAFTTSMSIT